MHTFRMIAGFIALAGVIGSIVVFIMMAIVRIGFHGSALPGDIRYLRLYRAMQKGKLRGNLRRFGHFRLIDDSAYGKLWVLTPESARALYVLCGRYDRDHKAYYRRLAIMKNSAMVEVEDPSTGETYLLPVPHESFKSTDWSFDRYAYVMTETAYPKTAHEAVAWTFGLTPAEYQPLVQT